MDHLNLLIDLHRDGQRQGPGGDAETELALQLAGVDRTVPLKVADIGCGTGASSLLLAQLLNARITAVITWTTASRPTELQQHWQTEYPEIDLASARIGLLEQHGYAPTGYFVLPKHCWLDHDYRPMQARFNDFLARHGHSEAARAIVSAEEHEIHLYEAHSAHFGYGVYVARKVG